MLFTITETSKFEKMMATIEELKAQNERLELENNQLKEEKKEAVSASNASTKSLQEALDVKEEKLHELKKELLTLRIQKTFINSVMRYRVERLKSEKQEMMVKMEEVKKRAEHFKKQFLLLENKVQKGEVKMEYGKVEDVPDNIPTCQICVRPYSISNIDMTPRTLGCGHTLCEECAKKIVETENIRSHGQQMSESKDICCPFDRIRTKMEKGVTGLPKNFAIIELIGNN